MARRLVVSVALVASAFAVPAGPSYADGPTDLYVATADGGGDDANDCTQATDPCLTVQHAVDLAAPSGTTIHIGAGTFDGQILTNGISVSLVGLSPEDTVLTNTYDEEVSLTDLDVLELGAGTTSLSQLSVSGGYSDVVAYGTGLLHADHVTLADGEICDLGVLSGATADLTDSTVQGGGMGGDCAFEPRDSGRDAQLQVLGGSLTLVRTQVLGTPDIESSSASAALADGGTLTADQSIFDAETSIDSGPTAIALVAGSAEVTRSAMHGFSGGVYDQGGTAFVSDSTIEGVGTAINSESGSVTVVRSTIQNNIAALVPDGGAIAAAGLILGPEEIKNCAGTITDLGYNLSTDDSCGFTGTSQDDVTGLHLDEGLAYRGGPSFLDTVGILWPSSAVDTIPAGATYGDQQPLCPASGATDLRGVDRPGGGACDAGSMEMADTVTTIDIPKKVKPHTDVDFQVKVVVPQIDLTLDSPTGFVTVRSGDRVLCESVAVESNEALCSFDDIPAGKLHLTADFTPVDDNTVHPSSAKATILSGTRPALKLPRKVVVKVGEKLRIKLKAAGLPEPLVRKLAGSLPGGLDFHGGRGTATITGKAKAGAVGRHHIRVRATNLSGQDTHRLVIVVKRR